MTFHPYASFPPRLFYLLLKTVFQILKQKNNKRHIEKKNAFVALKSIVKFLLRIPNTWLLAKGNKIKTRTLGA